MTDNGIVILGAPRSGTTLLRRILDAHPNIACPPETYVLSGAARFLHEDGFSRGLQIGALTGLGYAGFEEDEVLARLRAFAFGFLDDHATRQGKGRWAHKTAFDAFHVPKIRKICSGHVHFVCLKRHGLDVVGSLQELVDKTGGFVAELHGYIRKYPEPLIAYAHAWVDAATAIAKLVHAEPKAMTVGYEDLASDPEAVVREILEFVGEPWDDGLLDRALSEANSVGFGDWKTYGRKRIDTASVERWRKLPTPTQAALAEICNPTLELLGYDEVVIEDEDEDDARRRYELGLLVNRMRAAKAQESDPE
jgi:hypothetical protein